MICEKCGKEIKEGTKFCNFCGTPVAAKQAKEAKNTFLPGFITGFTAIVVVVAILLTSGIIRFSGKDYSGALQSEKLECDGFSSPEEAVAEYLNALTNRDLDKMISCFAIESYVESYDAQAAIERIKIFNPAWVSSNNLWPDLGELSKEMNVKRRESTVFSTISNQYIALCTNANSDSYALGYKLNDYSDYYEFLSDFVSDKKETLLSELSFNNEFDSWDKVLTDFEKEEYIKHREIVLYSNDAIIEPLFATFDLNGSSYVLAIDAVKYNGRWYLYSPNACIDTLFNSGLIEK